ncbi:RodZ family helix-turn-helix domain-containing protein [Thiomicrospira sp. ALE5]|uniref:helix-turn-helix domain-containing protein n=1 Tax=Thiomicrospira sp. ALE5 TaxID=748650 RepID=UPI0008EF1563|nr:helix-turn-helix domain-containing protein [Thiomicrospira sp. ALE5]SFR63181.1 cytoskeleton protein RodZ [Thiomicrospira sp. ALE5]
MTEENLQQADITLGEALLQARLDKDLTKEAMADIMKLSVDKISNLEAYTDLSSLSPFERGYVRNYASKVGLDLKVFELETRDVDSIAAELQPIAKENWSKPLFPWFKALFLVSIIASTAVGLILYLN